MLIPAAIYHAIKIESIWFEPNSPEDFIEGLIVFVSIFAAEISGF